MIRPAVGWLLVACAGLAFSCSPSDPPPQLAGGSPPPGFAFESPVFAPFTVRGRRAAPMELSYEIAPDDGPLDARTTRDLIQRALAAWAETGLVAFHPAEPGQAPDIVYRWEPPVSEDHPTGRFGRDTSIAMTGPVGPECLVAFDAGREWSEREGDAPSFFQAALHETGHALGLGHSDDPNAVLHAQYQGGARSLAPSDLHGLYSIYGGGSDDSGDLVIETDDPSHSVPVLRRIAPPDATDWTLFDCNGDGSDELLVWATKPESFGALTVYEFAAGPLLVASRGPTLGVSSPGGELWGHVGESGERSLMIRTIEGALLRRPFDSDGRLAAPMPAEAGEFAVQPPARTGDLDGDGAVERVHRIE